MPDQVQKFVIEVDDSAFEVAEKKGNRVFDNIGKSGQASFEKVGVGVGVLNAALLRVSQTNDLYLSSARRLLEITDRLSSSHGVFSSRINDHAKSLDALNSSSATHLQTLRSMEEQILRVTRARIAAADAQRAETTALSSHANAMERAQRSAGGAPTQSPSESPEHSTFHKVGDAAKAFSIYRGASYLYGKYGDKIFGGGSASSGAASGFGGPGGPIYEATFTRSTEALTRYEAAATSARGATIGMESAAARTALTWDSMAASAEAAGARIAGIALPIGIATVAAIGARKAFNLAYESGVAAEERLFLSDRTRLPATTIQQYQDSAQIAGLSKNFFVTTATGLDSTLADLSKNRKASEALDTLGISARDAFGNLRSGADVLSLVADHFDRIEDPVKRSRIAFQLFGDQAGVILPQLSHQLNDNVERLESWGAILSESSTRQAAEFKRDVDALTGSLHENASSFSIAGAAAKAWAERAVVGAYRGTREFLSGNPFLGTPLFDRAQPPTPAEIEKKRQDRENQIKTGFLGYVTGRSDDVFNQEAKSLLRSRPGDAVFDARRKELEEKLAISRYYPNNPRTEQLRNLVANYDKFTPGGELTKDFSIETVLGKKDELERQLGKLKEKRDAAIGALTGLKNENDPNRLPLQQFITKTQHDLDRIKAQIDAIDDLETKKKESAQRIQTAERSAAEFRRREIEEEFQGVNRIDILRREELAKNGLTAKARADIEIGVQAFAERAKRQEFLLTLEFEREASKTATDRLLRDQEQRGAYAAKVFLFGEDTTERVRQTSENRALYGVTEAGYSRDQQLRSLEAFDQRTLADKVLLEQKKLDIEQDYLTRSLRIRADALDRGQARDIKALNEQRQGELSKADEAHFPEIVEAYRKRNEAIVSDYTERAHQLSSETQAGLISAQQNTLIASGRLIEENYQKQFDRIRQGASGLLDAVFSRNPGTAVSDFFKAQFLGAVKDIASNQLGAATFRLLNPGVPLKYSRGDGPLGNIFGQFHPDVTTGSSALITSIDPLTAATDINNDLLAENNRVLLDLTNRLLAGYGSGPTAMGAGGGSFHAASARSVISLATDNFFRRGPRLPQFARFITGGAGAASVSPSIYQESIGSVATGGFPRLPSGLIDRTGQSSIIYGGTDSYGIPLASQSTGIFGGGPDLGGPFGAMSGGGTAAQYPASAGGPSSLHGILGSLGIAGKGGFNLASLKGLAFDPNAAALVTAQLGGGALAGIGGSLAGFATSPAGGAVGTAPLLAGLRAKRSTVLSDTSTTTGGALLGANLAYKSGFNVLTGAGVGTGGGLLAAGLKRGGFIGLGEDIGGGALAGASIGAQYGGPIGALLGTAIGAAAGGVAGTARLFIKSGWEQVRDQVKNMYSLNIDRGMSEQILGIVNQSYHGSISFAIRSQQVLDLLNLYAQSTGQSFFLSNKPQPLLLAQSAGRLQQQAVFSGGHALSYAGLDVLNGPPGGTFNMPQNPIGGYGSATRYIGAGRFATTPNPAPIQVIVHNSIPAAAVGDYFGGQVVSTVSNNPRIVVDAQSNAYSQNYGRRQNAAQAFEPGTFIP